MATLSFATTIHRPRFQILTAIGPFASDESHVGFLNFEHRKIERLQLYIKATGTADTGGALTFLYNPLPAGASVGTPVYIAGVQGMRDAAPVAGTAIDAAALVSGFTPGITYLGGCVLEVFLHSLDTLVKMKASRIGDSTFSWAASTGGNFSFDFFSFLIEYGER